MTIRSDIDERLPPPLPPRPSPTHTPPPPPPPLPPQGYFFGKHYKQTPRMDALRKDQSELIYLNATLNSECFKTIDEVTKKPVFAGGNATEQAFLLLADQWGVDYRQMRQKHPLHRKYIFSSATKMSHAVFRHGQGYRMFTKGAWDWVIEECTHATTLEGKVVAVSWRLRWGGGWVGGGVRCDGGGCGAEEGVQCDGAV